MHIVQFIEVLIPAGTSTVLSTLTRSLLRDGHRVTVLIGRGGAHNDAALIQALRAAGSEVIELDWQGNPYNAAKFLQFARRTRQTLGSIKPDLVHVHSYYSEQALHLSRYQGAPIVATIHTDSPTYGSSAPQHRVRDALARRFYLRRDVKLVTVSEYLAQRIRAVFRLGDKPIEVIWNALSQEWFEPIDSAAPRDVDILQVGRMDHNKDQLFAVAVLAELAKRGTGFKAMLAGDGPLLASVRQAVTRNGLSDRIECPGSVHDPRPLYRRARVAVTASHYEACPMVPIEALASGAACVASDIPAHREVLDGGNSGVLLPPGDVDAWVRALQELLNNDARRAQFAESGLLRAKAAFSWHQAGKSYERVYLQAIDQS
jgi:glycosyltransferase involved in cell wall biosynthesis